ncbi:MAG: hypothetical protein JKY37_00030 [Nannocystaceae bacterium]|nr:hypothetical protein [Nannocystaceae bacterium]
MAKRISMLDWKVLGPSLLLFTGCPAADESPAAQDTGTATIVATGGTGEGSTGVATSRADSDDSAQSVGTTATTRPEEDDSSAPVVFDHGGIPDAPPLADSKCRKVDFLFIIDNSSSMGAYQTNLVNSFPGFIDGIVGTLESADSYQVGVITTDTYTDGAPGCWGLSSLVAQTGGFESSNMVYGPFADGFNYMTEDDDLATAFNCAATVGTNGDGNEQPMQAMIDAVQRVEGGAGQCNEGFLRDDSLLVIVDIGDEYDNSPGTPQSWYDDVVAARSDLAENVVILSIIDAPGGPCGSGQSADRAAFTALWGANGFEVPICVPDYAPYFAEAIDIIDTACENFVLPAG